MAVASNHLNASFRVVDLQGDVITSYQNFRRDITVPQATSFLEAMTLIRGTPVGNAFLTVTTELEEA